jgi:hypothetical protein
VSYELHVLQWSLIVLLHHSHAAVCAHVQIGMTFKGDQKAVIAALDKLADDEAALDVST